MIFGVLTVENLQQATRPGRSSLGNKERRGGCAAIRMANLHATSYAMPLTASAAAASTVATTVVAAASAATAMAACPRHLPRDVSLVQGKWLPLLYDLSPS